MKRNKDKLEKREIIFYWNELDDILSKDEINNSYAVSAS